MKIIWHWLILTGAIIITTYVLPSTIVFAPLYIVFIASACLMFINMTIKPIISLLTLPINLLTLGIFGLLFNGAILWALAYVIPGFQIGSFKGAVIAALIISAVNWILGKVLYHE
jgi:putative membrane protein